MERYVLIEKLLPVVRQPYIKVPLRIFCMSARNAS